MIHLTLNTGHTHTVKPPTNPAAIHRALGNMVVRKGDLIPGFSPWRTVITRGDGNASFDIRRGKDMTVTFNVLAWTPEGANQAWQLLERQYLATSSEVIKLGIPLDLEMPEQPTQIPWLVTWILPTATLHINPENISWMADFEQCLAATIIHKSS